MIAVSMESRTVLLGSVLGALTAVSCSSADNHAPRTSASDKTPFSLNGTEWRLVDLAGTPLVPDAKASLAFPADGKVAGNASCNRFMGNLTISGDTLKLTPLGTTMMACVGAKIGAQESTYLKALSAAKRYSWQDPYLLTYSDGFDKPLRFTRVASPHPKFLLLSSGVRAATFSWCATLSL